MRYFAEVAYHGGAYHGWQIQPNAMSVQEKLEDALGKLLRRPTGIIGSGRTDTGVHCSQQFFHFDTPEPIDTAILLHKINAFLPQDIALGGIWAVQPEAHARFDALSRKYTYHMHLRKDAFVEGRSFFSKHAPDFALLNEAAAVLKEFTDFEAFSKLHSDVRTHNCQIMEAYWRQGPRGKLEFHIRADRFLRGMIRITVGNLLQVGLERMSLHELRDILRSRDRSRAGKHLVPGHGLYLSEVVYPQEIWLEGRPAPLT